MELRVERKKRFGEEQSGTLIFDSKKEIILDVEEVKEFRLFMRRTKDYLKNGEN